LSSRLCSYPADDIHLVSEGPTRHANITTQVNMCKCQPDSGLLLSVFAVFSEALTSNESSSAEVSSSGGYAMVTVALAVGLGAVLSVLIVLLIAGLVRLARASRQKQAADTGVAVTGDDSARRVGGSRRRHSWGFDSIRSKYSITGDDSIDVQ